MIMQYKFKSCLFSKGNNIFPSQIIIDTTARTFTFFKRRLVGYDQTILKADRIVAVSIRKYNELLLLSEITISTYGSELHINGLSSKDANEIRSLIEKML
jgi:hypothetical protein